MQGKRSASPAIASARFIAGAEVEVRSEDEGFRDAWYEATVTRSAGNGRGVYVVYASLVTDGDSPAPLAEFCRFSHVRPRPLRPDPGARFEAHQLVDAFYNDGWWTGVISVVHDGDPTERYTVCFPTSREEMEFKPTEIRPRLDWIDGQWCSPADRGVPLFAAGEAVEVSGYKEEFGAAWLTGTILKVISNTIFFVDYTRLKVDGDSEMSREIIDAQYIRPIPPCSPMPKEFEILSTVEAYHPFGWLVGVVSEILDGGASYIVRLNYRNEKMEYQISELRIHYEWISGEWHPASKGDRGGARGPRGGEFVGKVVVTPAKIGTKRKRGRPRTISPEGRKPRNKSSKTEKPPNRITPMPQKKCSKGEGLPKESSKGGEPLTISSKREKSPNGRFRKPQKKCSKGEMPPKKSSKGGEPLKENSQRGGPPKKISEGGRPPKITSEGGKLPKKISEGGKLPKKSSDPTQGKELEQAERTTDVVVASEQRREYSDLSTGIHQLGPRDLVTAFEDLSPILHINGNSPNKNSTSILTLTQGDSSINCLTNPRLPDAIHSTPNSRVEEMPDATTPVPSLKENSAGVISDSFGSGLQGDPCSASGKEADNMDLMAPPGYDSVVSCKVRKSSKLLSKVSVEGSASTVPSPSALTLSFEKRSAMWKSIESMEVFRIMPQQPHFSQLDKYTVDFREGMALGLMITFADLVANMGRFHSSDSQVVLERNLKTLVTLEANGFDVQFVRSRMEELLEIRKNQKELEEKNATLKTQILERENVKDRLDSLNIMLEKTIAELEQWLARFHKERDSLVMKRKSIESDIERLRKDLQAAVEACSSAEKRFDAVAVSPWQL